MIQLDEKWKAIKGFLDYQVSNRGSIRSWKGLDYLILKSAINSAGYPQVALFRNKKLSNKSVHRLVLEAFVGECPEGHQANHKDGNKSYNYVINLEWVTPSKNMQHAIETKLFTPSWHTLKGEKSVNAKLKDGEVWLIKKLLWFGIQQKSIAKMFRISRGAIVHIKAERTWSHIQFIPTDKDHIKKGDRIC